MVTVSLALTSLLDAENLRPEFAQWREFLEKEEVFRRERFVDFASWLILKESFRRLAEIQEGTP